MKRIIKKIKDRFFINMKEEDKLTAESVFQELIPENLCQANCSQECLNPNHNHIIQCEHMYEDLELYDFDPEKNTILIIDDNEGMVSFLEDDIELLEEKGIIDKDKVNILCISGLHAAFTFELLLEKYGCLNIKWAIIDITLGGSKMTSKGNLKYTGVDVFEMIYEGNPGVNYLFYTGNSLNPYINANKKIIKQFKKITGEDIMDYVLFKTSMDMDNRRKYIAEFLFGEYI